MELAEIAPLASRHTLEGEKGGGPFFATSLAPFHFRRNHSRPTPWKRRKSDLGVFHPTSPESLTFHF